MSTLFRLVSVVALVTLGYALAHLQAVSTEPVPPSRAAKLLPDPTRSEADPQLVKALLEPDPLTRQRETIRVLQTLPADRTRAVRASLRSVALAPGDVELAFVGEWMAQHDPRAAFQWAMSDRYANHPWVLSSVLRTWARNDPRAAAEGFYQIRNANLLGTALGALLLGWDEGGHPGLTKFMHTFEQGAAPQAAIESLVQRKIVRDGPDATIRWAEALPEDDPTVVSRFKRNVMRRVASALAEWDPQAGMDWASTFGEGPYGRGAYRRVAIRTVRADGPGTMNWLSELPTGSQRDGAIQEAYRTWLGVDRVAATAWIEERKDEKGLDAAHAMYAQTLMTTAGHKPALDWLERVDQHLRKKRTGTKIARAWFLRDPDATNAWLESGPAWVDEETRGHITAPRQQRPSHNKRKEAAQRNAALREKALEAAPSAADAMDPADAVAP